METSTITLLSNSENNGRTFRDVCALVPGLFLSPVQLLLLSLIVIIMVEPQGRLCLLPGVLCTFFEDPGIQAVSENPFPFNNPYSRPLYGSFPK